MTEKLPIFKGYRLKKGVYDRKKGFFVEFPSSKRFILLKETEKAYLVRSSNLRGIVPTDFSIKSVWIPKWGLKLIERVGWSDTTSHSKSYDKLELWKGIQLAEKIKVMRNG